MDERMDHAGILARLFTYRTIVEKVLHNLRLLQTRVTDGGVARQTVERAPLDIHGLVAPNAVHLAPEPKRFRVRVRVRRVGIRRDRDRASSRDPPVSKRGAIARKAIARKAIARKAGNCCAINCCAINCCAIDAR